MFTSIKEKFSPETTQRIFNEAFIKESSFPPVLLLNARSIVNKYDEFLFLISKFKPGLACVTESWLNVDIDDSFLHIHGYCIFRDDRLGRKGGGVCSWVRTSLSPTLISPRIEKPSGIECLLFSLASIGVMVILLYIPPGLTVADHDSIYSFLSAEIEYFLSVNPNQSFLICGDINDFPATNLAEDFGFTNKVISPTRQGSFLDQIWVDENLTTQYENAEIGAPLGNSDHNCVILNPVQAILPEANGRMVSVWDYRASNVREFVACLSSLDFNVIEQASDVEEMCAIFYNMFSVALSHIPCNFVQMSSRDKVWMTPVLKLLIDKRWAAYRSRDWKLFLHYKERVKTEIVKAKRVWAKRQCVTRKHVWNVVKDIRNKNCNVSSNQLQEQLGGINNMIADLTRELSQNFNLADDVVLSPISDQKFNFVISEEMVFRKLVQLKNKKAAGPDNIAPRLLKEGASWLCIPLCKIFNRSIAESTFPSAFKIAKVSPIPKKSQPTIKDFRPISLLSALSKIFEQLVLDHVKFDLLNLYGRRQHAFRPLGSTTSALIDIVDSVSSRMDLRETSAVHVTCLDLTKAFDKLNHHRLLNYLNERGIGHGFLHWLHSYLSNRFQYISVDGVSGPVFRASSGVPQGSTLGPYLFAAYIGSVLSAFKDMDIILYADDLTVIETVSHVSVSTVNDIVEFISDIGLIVNTQKCTVLCIKRSENHSCTVDVPFPVKDQMKILGFILDCKLSWKVQISSVVSRASKLLYVIRVLKNIVSVDDLKCIYHALITSLIMYGSPVYGRLSCKLLTKLERLQGRAHRIICGVGCVCLDFQPIKERFLEAVSKFLLKCESHEIHPLHSRVPKRSKRQMFILPQCRTERRLRTFFPFACLLHNKQI